MTSELLNGARTLDETLIVSSFPAIGPFDRDDVLVTSTDESLAAEVEQPFGEFTPIDTVADGIGEIACVHTLDSGHIDDAGSDRPTLPAEMRALGLEATSLN